MKKEKKEKAKISKEFESRISALNDELLRSYVKVDKIYKENIKILEENKVLRGIHKVNTDISEKLKEAKNQSKEQVESESMENEEEQEEEDEEIEMINLFMEQKQKR